MIKDKRDWYRNTSKYAMEVKRFAYPLNTAISRRYVYFDGKPKGLESDVSGLRYMYPGPSIMENIDFSGKLIETWSNIFNAVEQRQKVREQNFINNARNYLGDLSPLEKEYINNYNTGTKEQSSEYLIKFFQAAIVNQDLTDILEQSISEDSLRKVFILALDKYAGKIPQLTTDSQAEDFTNKLYTTMLDYLIKDMIKQSPQLSNRLKGVGKSQAILNMLKTLGYIRPENYKKKLSIATQYLRELNKDNRKNNYNLNSFKSSFIGIREEMIRMLTVGLKNNTNAKISYLGTSSSSGEKTFQKTDISIFIPDIENKLPPTTINLSVKSASFAKESNFILPAKLVGKGSLQTRYKEIESSLTNLKGGSASMDLQELNKLFFMINNELVERTTMVDIPQIIDILSYISLRWMFNLEDFQEVKQSTSGNGTLNFFAIGGKIIPSSVVFGLIKNSLREIRTKENQIVKININPPTQELSYNYYIEKGYAERAADMLNEHTKEKSWNWARDWIEQRGQMAFYLQTTNLFKILKLDI